jgi:hypothetical protein
MNHPTRASRCALPALVLSLFATTVGADIEYVIAISVDGLRGDFLQTFIDTAPSEFPNFVRLRNQSAFTYSARCDYSHSITIPDHLCMLTGRPVLQPTGMPNTTHHGYTSDVPAASDTVHAQGNPAVPYKASIFDVAHDRGLSTAFYASKDRLTICDRSYNAVNGALDTIGVDNGRDKIDFTQILESGTSTLRSTLTNHIGGSLERFTFFHIAETDYAGHAGGWSTTVGSQYRNAIKTADTHLGAILNAIEARPALSGKVAVLLTADHGGGGAISTSHTESNAFGNYNIPMFISAPGFVGGTDLYTYFSNRVSPGTDRPDYAAPGQPFRNTDIGNLAAALLGLPAIPGSLAKPEFIKPVSIERASTDLTIRWPGYLTGYELEFTDSLNPSNWQKVPSGISQVGAAYVHTFSYAPETPNRFFRLHLKPDQPANANVAKVSTTTLRTTPAPTPKKRRYRFLPDGSLELLR